MTPTSCHELINAVSQAATVEDIHKVCAELTHRCEFEQFIYGASIPTSFVKPYLIIISGYPAEWRERYNDEQYIELDPTVVHCAHNHLPLNWSSIPAVPEPGSQLQRFMDEARDFGLNSGVSFPLHTANGDFAMLSLASPEDHQSSCLRIMESLPFGQLFVAYLHEAVRHVFQQDLLPLSQVDLTDRERECLLWVTEGKTAWETSRILRISERTVNFHLHNAQEKLGVVNGPQAIARAVTLGLISPQLN